MRLFRHIGLFLGLSLALAAYGLSAQAADAPPIPDRNPMRAPAKPLLPGEAKTIPWSKDEIAAAKAACRTLLDGAAIDYEELAPIKEGLCGTPAPILVRAIGSDPQVTIEPPATTSCPLAKALLAWLGDTVQRHAKAELGSPVVGLRNATSYACRNRYGAERAPISEHALANALDISEFKLASGISITVLKAWPVAAPPAPKETSEGDAKGDEAAKSAAEAKKGGDDASGAKVDSGAESAQERPKLTPDDRVEATPASATKAPPAAKESVVKKSAPEKQPAPAPVPPASAETEPTEPSTKFVRAMHTGACKAFGTVLGPAANAAHHDHFHFDMKQRRKGFCE